MKKQRGGPKKPGGTRSPFGFEIDSAELTRLLARVALLESAVARYPEDQEEWQRRITQVYERVEADMQNRLDQMAKRVDAAKLLTEMETMGAILARNAEAHRQEQAATTLKLRVLGGQLERLLWWQGKSVDSSTISLLRQELISAGADLTNLKRGVLESLLYEAVRRMFILGGQ